MHDVDVKHFVVTEETRVLRRVGKSGLKSNLTGDFGSMNVQEDYVRKEEKGGGPGAGDAFGGAFGCAFGK